MTIKSSIFVGLFIFSTCTGTIPAHAQIIVQDPSALTKAIQEVTQLGQQLQWMEQQYQQMMQTAQAVSHMPQSALNQLSPQLNVQQYRNPLASSSTDISSVMNGAGTGTGTLGSTTQSYLNQNRIYQPSGQDFQAQQMNRNAISVAGAQAMASQLYQSSESHIQTLQNLEGELSSAPDAKAVADIQARIAMEQTYFQGQQVQAQSLAMWQQAQERNLDQQNAETRRSQIDDLIGQATAHGG